MKNVTMKKIFYFAIVIAIISSCKSEFDLRKDKNITSVFSNTEIDDIGKMIDYVDSRILNITEESDIKSAYKKFWKEVEKGKVKPLSEQILPFKDEEKYIFLKTLNESTFDAFFKFDTCFQRVRYRDTVYTDLCGIKYIELSHNGKYMTYLKETGKTNIRFKDLHDKLEAMGDVSVGVHFGFASIYENVDIESPEWRLLSTFLILKTEELIEAKIDKYFENKK